MTISAVQVSPSKLGHLMRVMGLLDRQAHKLCRGKERKKTKKEVGVWLLQPAEREREQVSETVNHILCWSFLSLKMIALLSASKPNNKITTSFCVPVVPIHHVAKLIHLHRLTAHCVLQAPAIPGCFFSLSTCVILNCFKSHQQPGSLRWGRKEVGEGRISG